MTRLLLAAAFSLLLTPAPAQPREEPVGCESFKWPLDSERALLSVPGIAAVDYGAEIALPIDKAVSIRLRRPADAGLPMPPERPQRSQGDKAGFVRVAAPAQAGPYRITLADAGWIDVIQNGRLLKAGAFSGATGCKGVRKSVTFELAAEPFIIQFSGVPADMIGMVMTQGKPDDVTPRR